MSLFKGLLAALTALCLMAAPAWADHMTGEYSGTGQAAGTYLVIKQTGRTVIGQLSGATQGSLNGQSDGGENVSGTIDITGVGQLQFQALHSQAGMTIKLIGDGGTEEYVFTRGTVPTTQQPQPQPQPQPNQPSEDYYVGQNGQQIGPVTRQQILEALAAGQARPTDLVWKQGMPDWAPIQSLPEFAQASKGPPPLPPSQPGPPPLPTDGGPAPGPLSNDNTGPGQVPYNSEHARISAIMLGSTLGIFGHELGHAMIGELQLPATGAEEDTADEFSALILSSILEDTTGMSPDMVSYLTEVVSYSTLLWYHDAARSEQQGAKIPWYDEHSASETRFRNTLCMIYGSSPARFKALADRVQLPERERGRCETDHAKRYRAWELIVAPHARDRGGEYPGQQPADAPGAALRVSYERSATQFGQQLQGELENLKLFEQVAAGLQDLLVWQRDLDIIFADCGMPNAFYDPSNARIVMCWEGIEYFFWTVAEPEGVKTIGLRQN